MFLWVTGQSLFLAEMSRIDRMTEIGLEIDLMRVSEEKQKSVKMSGGRSAACPNCIMYHCSRRVSRGEAQQRPTYQSAAVGI